MTAKHFSGIFLYFVCLNYLTFGDEANSKICSLCHHNPKEGSHLVQFCRKENVTGELQLDISCCINTTSPSDQSQIVGLDLSDCELKTINGLFSNLQNLNVLMLENNTELKIKQDDFQGLSNLAYLSLPSNLQCPGGNTSWDSIENNKISTICEGEINLCVQNNMTCQNNNSHCVLTGPGEVECLCLPGHYGYKCLRQGTFPTVNYTIILCACTVGISGLLWCTQRRKVKRKSHTQ